MLGVGGKRTRRLWRAKCPLPDHDDEDPSWSIVDDPADERHGSWYCFGCDEGGGPVQLAAAIKNVTSQEAAEWLREVGVVGVATKPQGIIVEVASAIPSRLRWPIPGLELDPDKWPEAAKRYFEHTRGLLLDLASRHGIGATSEGKPSRSIVIPVESFGSIRTWASRSYVSKEHSQAQRRDGAQPEMALWGEPWLKPGKDPALVCEAVFDGLSLTALGFRNVVAVLGASALTPAKLAAIARCDDVVVCTDNDKAGDSAASRIMQSLARHCRVVRALPPEGHDFGSAPVDQIIKVMAEAMRRLEVE